MKLCSSITLLITVSLPLVGFASPRNFVPCAKYASNAQVDLWRAAPVHDSMANSQDLHSLISNAEAGDAASQYCLGRHYATAAHAGEAIKWLHRAAERGHSSAMLALGMAYEQGSFVDMDMKQALHWLDRASESGSPQAKCELALMYEKGRGVEQDYSHAARLYREAAEQNLPRGKFDLAFMYEYGKGVPQDAAKAVQLYREAAPSVGEARYNLAMIYSEGRPGVPVNPAAAIMWAQLASNKGVEKLSLDGDTSFIQSANALVNVVGRTLHRSQKLQAKRLAQDWMKEHHVLF